MGDPREGGGGAEVWSVTVGRNGPPYDHIEPFRPGWTVSLTGEGPNQRY